VAVAAAKAANSPLFVDFFASWCEGHIYKDPSSEFLK